jgi:hypothetical protein
MGNVSIMLKAIGTYSLVGFALDLVMLIIILSSDKNAYSVGVDTSMQNYTLHSDSDEII